jgi:hypothetical protein
MHARDEAAKGGVAHHHGGQGARRLAAWRQKKDGRGRACIDTYCNTKFSTCIVDIFKFSI